MTALAVLFLALVLASARAAYRWHEARRVPPLDPFWTTHG